MHSPPLWGVGASYDGTGTEGEVLLCGSACSMTSAMEKKPFHIDTFTPPRLSRELASGLPDSTLVMLEGASHAGAACMLCSALRIFQVWL